MHTHTHTHTYTLRNTITDKNTHADTHVHALARTHTHTHTLTHTYMHTDKPAHMHTHTYAHTNTHTHTHTHTHAHTHTYAYPRHTRPVQTCISIGVPRPRAPRRGQTWGARQRPAAHAACQAEAADDSRTGVYVRLLQLCFLIATSWQRPAAHAARTQLAKLKQQMIQEQVCACVFFSFAFVSQRHDRGMLRTQLARSSQSCSSR